MNQKKNEQEMHMKDLSNEKILEIHQISSEEILRQKSLENDRLNKKTENQFLETKEVLEKALINTLQIDEEAGKQFLKNYQKELYKNLKHKREKDLKEQINSNFKEQKTEFQNISNLLADDIKKLQECYQSQLAINEINKTLDYGLQAQIEEKKRHIQFLYKYTQENAYKNINKIQSRIMDCEIRTRQNLLDLKSFYSVSSVEISSYLILQCHAGLPKWFAEIEETLWGPRTFSKEFGSLRKVNINLLLNWEK
jgi:hypothetical protein